MNPGKSLTIKLPALAVFITLYAASGLAGSCGLGPDTCSGDLEVAGADRAQDEILYASKTAVDLKVSVSNVSKVGGIADTDEDGDLETAFLTKNDILKTVEPDGNSNTLARDMTDIGGAGDLDDDGDAEFVTVDDNDHINYVDQGGEQTFIDATTPVSGQGVGGVGDFDSDGDFEALHINGGGDVAYRGTFDTAGTDLGASAEDIGGYGDIDDDSEIEVIHMNNNDLETVELDGDEKTLKSGIKGVGGVGDLDYNGKEDAAYYVDENTPFLEFQESGSTRTTDIEMENPGGIADIDGDTASVLVEAGTTLNPEGSSAVYYFRKNEGFNSVEVYDSRINLSSTNISTTSTSAVNVSIWNYPGQRTMLSDRSELKFEYNTSAETDFYDLNSSLHYKVRFNGSPQRDVTGQEWLNVSVPANTNLTVRTSTSGGNSAPSAPGSPTPSDGAAEAETSPELGVEVSDPDGDSMDVWFFDSSDDSLIDKKTGVSSGSAANVTWSSRSSGTSYSWYAVAGDGEKNTTSSTFSFTTDNKPRLVSDSQFYTNYTGHEFETAANAYDDGGESDFSKCVIEYSEPDGNSGTTSGTIDTSYGNSTEVKCEGNLSSSISSIDVGESVTTSVSFYDGSNWINTSSDSNHVPNEAPTAATSKTDLGDFITDQTPSIQWSGQDDPDGDSMTVKAYTGTSSSPTTKDNSASASTASMELGQSVTLEDGKTYYYRLEFCDSYGECSSYTSSDRFSMNQEPRVTSLKVNDSSVSKGDEVYAIADVSKDGISSVNFTAKEGGTVLFDSRNGTWVDSNTWESQSWTADQEVKYEYTVEATDNRSETTTNTSSFLIENDEPELVTDTQSFTNKTGHAYDIEGYAFDPDGEDDFTSCEIEYNANSQSGTVSGSIDTSYGNSTEVKCAGTLSNSESGVNVLEEADTSVRFYDGRNWTKTSFSTNVVPNNAPSAATSITDLGSFLTDHTPPVSWSGQSDSDGDRLTVKAYTETTQNPTTQDSSGSATDASLDLGQSVTLNDGKTYYYRLEFCDTWECSSYTSSDEFRMNEEPSVTNVAANVSNPSLNDAVEIRANVTDQNIDSVNFTVYESDTVIIDNANGTQIDSDTWKSSGFAADEEAKYDFSVTATDNASETGSDSGSFNTGYKQSGTYTRTFATADKVREAKVSVYGNENGGTIDISGNTSQSSVESLENATWTRLAAGMDLTVEFDLSAGGAGSSPNITGYDVEYRTDYQSPGSYTSSVRDLGYSSNIGELDVTETQPSNTNATYEIRTGSSSTVDSSWTDWALCVDSCEPSIGEDNRYLQFRINLTGTSSKSPEVSTFEVKYR